MTTETRPETPKFPKWMTREEYLESLPETDRGNLLTLIAFLTGLDDLKDELDDGTARIFVVGSTAVPKEVLGREANDIDTRVLMKDKPEDFHELFILMHNLYDAYMQSELVENFGQPRFNWHYEEDLSTDSPFIRFQPREGRPIDIFLPFITYDKDLDWFIRDHEMHFGRLQMDLSDRHAEGREEMIKKRAYIVPLT